VSPSLPESVVVSLFDPVADPVLDPVADPVAVWVFPVTLPVSVFPEPPAVVPLSPCCPVVVCLTPCAPVVPERLARELPAVKEGKPVDVLSGHEQLVPIGSQRQRQGTFPLSQRVSPQLIAVNCCWHSANPVVPVGLKGNPVVVLTGQKQLTPFQKQGNPVLQVVMAQSWRVLCWRQLSPVVELGLAAPEVPVVNNGVPQPQEAVVVFQAQGTPILHAATSQGPCSNPWHGLNVVEAAAVVVAGQTQDDCQTQLGPPTLHRALEQRDSGAPVHKHSV